MKVGIAAQWAGMEIVGQIEIDEFCIKILEKYWPNVKRMKNMFEVRGDEFGAVDIFAAGIPCQPFSTAGNRKGSSDGRYLWPETIRIISTMQPTWVVIENVDGIGTMEQSDSEIIMEDETVICTEAEMVLETIRKDLQTAGYDSITIEIPACAVNARHRRDRFFIVAYSDSIRRCSKEAGDSAYDEKRNDTSCEQPWSAEFHETVAGSSTLGHSDSERRTRTIPISKSTKFTKSSTTLADTKGDDERIMRSGDEKAFSRLTCSSSDVADTGRNGCIYRENEERSAGGGKQTFCNLGSSDNNVADSSCSGRKKRNITGKPARKGYNTGGGDARGRTGTTKSGLGGVLDGLSTRIYRFTQPAFMGQPQYEWEPPRVAAGVKNRTKRLKALGNAVHPLQIYPVLQVIYWIENGII